MSKIYWSCHPVRGGVLVIARKFVGGGVAVEIGIAIPPSHWQDETWSKVEQLAIVFKVAEKELDRMAELEAVKVQIPTLH